MTDIEIAQSTEMLPIQEVAAKIGISPDNLELARMQEDGLIRYEKNTFEIL